MNRRFKVRVSQWMVAVLLFAQLAVTAYACPRLMPPDAQHESHAAIQPADAAEGCEQHDLELPNLCLEHDRFGLQALDHAQPPSLPPMIVAGLFATLPEPAQPAGVGVTARYGIAPATPPPHAILHCCLRA